jgi:cytochrome c oxidase assembly protein subunit 15
VTIASTTASAVAGHDRLRDRRAIRIWLYAIAAMVLAMVVVGGATRLTESGLSITEWEPIHGVIPPLNETDWQEEFTKYQQIPEYQEINLGMTLAEFKTIYWWEWSHRLLGRLIGVVFLVPFLWFWATGRIERSLWPRLVAIFVLGGLQGAAGWWMVASGLTERTDVSQYRLAIHLILASLIFAYLIWVARGLRPSRPGTLDIARGVKVFANVLIVLMFLQLYFGALVAGLNAGFAFNDWPAMGGQLVPPGILDQEPWWRNFFENVATVQFQHRMLAYLIAALVVAHAIWLARRMPGSRTAFASYRLVAIVGLQVVIGVLTLVNAVPISLALAHQLLAFVLLAGVVMHRRGMTDPIPIR